MESIVVMDELTLAQRVVVWFLPVIFAITVHEVAHGWVAKKRGDTTASMLGRLTLNPIKHIDWIGTILVPAILVLSFTGFIFGWAKPVPVNDNNLRHPRVDMALVAIAGPIANFLMAFIWAGIARIGVSVELEAISLPLIYMGIAGISINLVLALINLIPIPPLDGSRVLACLLPPKWAWHFNRIGSLGLIVLLVLLMTDTLSLVLGYPLYYLQQFFFSVAGM
ncbi:MAG: site-2 protease family protein [Methylococcales bacterium]|jgi:Zn-dependent protease|nr:site-2 protease family protein [Methylococcaceae bacterium]HIL41552.1 site-2 protease family protein [Methylococcales bacterium]